MDYLTILNAISQTKQGKALLGKLGLNAEETSQVISQGVEDYSALKTEVEELNLKLEAVMSHVGVKLVKKEYVVEKVK